VPRLAELLRESDAVGAAHLCEPRAIPPFLLELAVRLDGAEDRDLGAMLLREQDRVPGRVRHVPLRCIHHEDALDLRFEAGGLEDDDVAGGLLDETVDIRAEDAAPTPSAPPSENAEGGLVLSDVVQDRIEHLVAP